MAHPRRHDDRGVRAGSSPTGSPPRSIPRPASPSPSMVYQPMLELLAYLRANGFKTFIVSGGGIEFMRPWTEKVYGIPPEQVVGTSGGLEVRTARRQAGARARLPELVLQRRQGRQARRHPAPHRPPPDRRLRQLRWRPADAAMDRRRQRARASASTSITPTPSASGPTTASRTSASSTRASTKPKPKAGPSSSMKDDWKRIFAFSE